MAMKGASDVLQQSGNEWHAHMHIICMHVVANAACWMPHAIRHNHVWSLSEAS